MTTPDIKNLGILIEKYFSAQISPQETLILSETASEILQNPGNLSLSHPKLLADLAVIRGLEDYLSVQREGDSINIPDGLESMLNRHISSLARKDRAKAFRRRILHMASCAAAIALFATVGFRYLGEEKLSDVPSRSQQTEIAASLDNHPDSSGTITIPPITDVTKKISESATLAKASSHQPSRHAASVVSSGSDLKMREKHSEMLPEAILSTAASIKIPDFPVMITDISPMIAAASIDPAKIMIQPLTTFGQTVFNVCETADIISDAFSGISQTLAMVSETISSANILSPQ